jgi:DNA-binding Xre family transcriptional regulator
MKVNYNKLWKLLIDRNMMKKDLRIATGMTTNAMAKLGRNENVSTEILCKICEVLECNIEDIVEVVDVTKVS